MPYRMTRAQAEELGIRPRTLQYASALLYLGYGPVALKRALREFIAIGDKDDIMGYARDSGYDPDTWTLEITDGHSLETERAKGGR